MAGNGCRSRRLHLHPLVAFIFMPGQDVHDARIGGGGPRPDEDSSAWPVLQFSHAKEATQSLQGMFSSERNQLHPRFVRLLRVA